MKQDHGRFFWKIFLGNAILLSAVAGAYVILIQSAFLRFYRDDQFIHLRTHAELLRQTARTAFDSADAGALRRLANDLAVENHGDIRVTFIWADGRVAADSQAAPERMDNHSARPEVAQALLQGEASSTRWSHTVARQMIYVALRVGPAEAPVGVVRAGVAADRWTERLSQTSDLPWRFALLILVTALALALGLSVLWSRPLKRLTRMARNLSRGDLSARLDVDSRDELGALARALNQMRDNLAGQLDATYRQRRTLEYLLAQLHEGVVVAGSSGRLMLINPAASRMLGISVSITSDGRLVDGLTVETCIPQHEVQRLLVMDTDATERRAGAGTGRLFSAAAEQEGYEEQRITVRHAHGAMTILARASDIVLPRPTGEAKTGAGLREDEDGSDRGRLLVLTDITELVRTLQIKSDFVANASHELRTPLSAIRAAVETLQSIDLNEDPAAGGRLLAVVDRHAHRLEALVSDLLSLSRLESGSAEFEPATLSLREVLNDVHEQFAAAMAERNLEWRATLPEPDTAFINRQLLRLILDNLVENAIKFTDRGGFIRVSFTREPSALVLTVQDNGCGIPAEDHDRVFERFYQVGRARSGLNRGTGLGLSIVRHAAAAMRGTITLQSAPGQGTTITLSIPQPKAG